MYSLILYTLAWSCVRWVCWLFNYHMLKTCTSMHTKTGQSSTSPGACSVWYDPFPSCVCSMQAAVYLHSLTPCMQQLVHLPLAMTVRALCKPLVCTQAVYGCRICQYYHTWFSRSSPRFSTYIPVVLISLSIFRIFHISLLLQAYIKFCNIFAVIIFCQKSLKRPPIGVCNWKTSRVCSCLCRWPIFFYLTNLLFLPSFFPALQLGVSIF